MEGIGKALERGMLAGKLRIAAMDYRRKADALDRAAETYSRGVGSALAGIAAGDAEGSNVSRPAPAHRGVGSSGDGRGL